MKNFPRGVSYYTKGTVEIGFPESDCCCWWCPLMKVDYTKREVCAKTGEILLAPQYSVGQFCPIHFNKENE